MILLERLDGDIYVISVGNKYVIIMGEYICDYYICDILYYMVGKNEFIFSFIY